MSKSAIAVVLLSCLVASASQGHAARPAAATVDEPGMAELLDEPGIELRMSLPAASTGGPRFRVDLAFGYASLVVDPDVDEGYGGGLSVTYGIHRRIGAEATVYLTSNPYAGSLGAVSDDFSSFMAGNITLGPVVQLTRPGARLSVSAEAALGTYVIVPPVPVQALSWTLGVSMGMTFSYRLTRWLGLGLKVRYHLFNLTTISGDDLVDRKAFARIGVIDRFELPGYVALFF